MPKVSTYLNFKNQTETKKLFEGLSAGGKIEMELQEFFWGGYYGSCNDKFGTQWMFNCSSKT